MSWLQQCFGAKIEWMHIFLAVFVTGTLWMLWVVQRNAKNGIDLTKLIVDKEGDPDWTKMSAIGAWIAATYVVIHSELSGKVVEGMIVLLLIYAGVYTLNRSAMVILSRIWPGGPAPPLPPPNQQIKVDAPADASVSVQTGGDKS